MNANLKLVYPDGIAVGHPVGVTGRQVAESIGPRLARAAVAVSIDGQALDLDRPLPRGGAFAVITEASDEGRHIL
ncbi:MAG TPA: TGS domain-containing protein, partial [Acidimicrobiia bacterium]|nr:TGS domain-containing protein [Acidimicrobiia bacterium]